MRQADEQSVDFRVSFPESINPLQCVTDGGMISAVIELSNPSGAPAADMLSKVHRYLAVEHRGLRVATDARRPQTGRYYRINSGQWHAGNKLMRSALGASI